MPTRIARSTSALIQSRISAPPLSQSFSSTPVRAVTGPEGVIVEGAPDAEPRSPRNETSVPFATRKNSTTLPDLVTNAADRGVPTLSELRRRAQSIIDETLERERRHATRAAIKGRIPCSQDGIENRPKISTLEPQILSNTCGYDFSTYMTQVIDRVRGHWYSLIPPGVAHAQQGHVVIIFRIVKNGGIEDLEIVANAGSDALDRVAMSAILASSPFPELPNDFGGDNIVLQLTFLYNPTGL